MSGRAGEKTAERSPAGMFGALRGRGATVTTIVPDGPSLAAIGDNLMDASRRDAVATAGYAQGRRITASG